MEGEKKINERINKVEEMIKRAHKMEDLMDYQSLSLDNIGCPKSHLKMYMRAMQPLGATKELLA